MIQRQDFHLTFDQVLALVDLPRLEGLPVKIHSLPPLPAKEFLVIMDPKVVGDTFPEVPMLKHLVFEAK